MLASVGAFYVVAATAVLAWFIVDAWSAAGFVDLFLQFALVAAGICGAWFVANAKENLGWRTTQHGQQRRA